LRFPKKRIRKIRADDVQYFGLDDISATPVTTIPPPLPFEIVEITKSGNSVTIRFNSVPGRTYAVDASNDVVDWSEELEDSLQAEAGDTTGFTELSVPAGIKRFYRVRRQP